MLPELRADEAGFEPALKSEYSSKDGNLPVNELRKLLASANDEIGRFMAV
jgi:hypothetical protein